MVDDINSNPEWLLISGADIRFDSFPELSLVQAGDFERILGSESALHLTGAELHKFTDSTVNTLKRDFNYREFIETRIATQFKDVAADDRSIWLLRLMCLGTGAFRAFLQSNVTGPPLSFNPERILLPEIITEDAETVSNISKACVSSLAVDGETAYHHTPHLILLILGLAILNSPELQSEDAPQSACWWKLRVNFFHQRILSEKTGTLYTRIRDDLESVSRAIVDLDRDILATFTIERAMVNTYFGNDAEAMKLLETSAVLTGLKYSLTGVMGKRTKFQQKDTSQLVVLAVSTEESGVDQSNLATKPESLDLNDDTLLESIKFTDTTTIKEDKDLPEVLSVLDPSNQPILKPLDSTILLLLTETIKNTNPADGVTREQMQPYANRVLVHSTNWEVYTLGLLVRSRLEASRSRTVERGVLQLQAVVDQVIADTSFPNTGESDQNGTHVSTFLPRENEKESATIRERLLYIHQLPIPTRWELEAELASLWTHLGGLKTALEIYERLEMWPEAALCWAAVDQEAKAREIVTKQLFDESTGNEREPPPPEAPRLWCILGDIDQNIDHYTKAWEVSGQRYARAQRSLGRYWLSKDDCERAAEAYGESLRIYPLHSQTWFSLGCCWLELQKWEGAVRAFRRVISLDESDAEAWSNLAIALQRRETIPVEKQKPIKLDDEEDDEENTNSTALDPQRNKKDALCALKRACALKRESWKIWDNYLTVAASLDPPAYDDIVVATRHLIELRKKTNGEFAVDADALEVLVRHVINTDLNSDTPTGYDPLKRGLPKAVVELIEKDVVPVITTNPRLWKIVARLELWRKRPKASLEAHEKAWRAVNDRPGITEATEKEWSELVEATVDLLDAYESLGQMERAEGVSAGELVAKDLRFKSRSTARVVMGKGKNLWEDTEGWGKLKNLLEELKA